MKRFIPLALWILLLTTAAEAAEIRLGADVSSLPAVEQSGGVFRQDGRRIDALEILRDHGLDFIRLRAWHTPADAHGGRAETMALADRARSLGLQILLDLHESDTWADPGHQTKPAAWKELPFSALCDSVYSYSRDMVGALAARGSPPAIVQIGNEIDGGLLWPEGRIGGSGDQERQWRRLAALINSGIRGATDGVDVPDSLRIMIHLSAGGDGLRCKTFLDHLIDAGVEFDLIGLSFYPWWHGSLDDLRSTMNLLAQRYDRDIIVVETAYPWTLGRHDDVHNLVGLDNQLLAGYPATPRGQRRFLQDLLTILRKVEGRHGLGLCYWEPAWISTPGRGSPWENLALFDFKGEALTGLDAFGR